MASLVTIWVSGIVVSSILSAWVEFQRSTRCAAALVPLARTHMVRLSAKALEAKAAVPIKRAASAAQVDRLFMAFLPGKFEDVWLWGKAPRRDWEKLFPFVLALSLRGGKGKLAGEFAALARAPVTGITGTRYRLQNCFKIGDLILEWVPEIMKHHICQC